MIKRQIRSQKAFYNYTTPIELRSTQVTQTDQTNSERVSLRIAKREPTNEWSKYLSSTRARENSHHTGAGWIRLE